MIEASQAPESGANSDFDVESFMAQADANEGTPGILDTQPESADEAAHAANTPQTPAAANATPAQEFEITANGQVIRAPVDKFKQWASQGYDYAQKMQALKAEQDALQAREKQYEQYKPVDEFIKQNPQWWEHVQSQWAQREQMARDPNNPLAGELQQLKSKLSEIEQFKQSIVQEREQAERESQDKKLSTEIESIRGEYPDLDWTGVDQSGKSLEVRVLEHAVQNGIKNFRAAFRDFNHDQLLMRAEARGKEAINKDIQKKAKLGLLGKTPAPTQQKLSPEDVRNKSYEDITADILESLSAS